MLEEIFTTIECMTALLYGFAAIFFTIALYLLLMTAEARRAGTSKWKTFCGAALVTALVFAGLISVECAHARRRRTLQNHPPVIVPMPKQQTQMRN